MGQGDGPDRIVVADDDDDIRRLVALTLRRNDYQVLLASSGDEALRLIQEELPQLALLDIAMPGLTGLEIAQALRADPATAAIPVVFLTAKGQVQDVIGAAEVGAKGYVLKPFRSADLVRRVAAALGREDAAR